MITYVQVYIHIRKGIEVNIQIRDTRDIFLLTRAYNTAQEWLQQQNLTLTQI